MNLFSLTIAAALLLAAHVALAESAVTVRAVELKLHPASDARTVVSLPAETAVDVVTRQGAWVQLKSGRTSGWTKLFDIRAAAATAPAGKRGSSGIADTLGLAMGTRGSSVTTGVRGLDAEMLAQAAPNAQEFAKMTRYARSKEQAAAFARAGKLQSREVADLGGTAKSVSGGAK